MLKITRAANREVVFTLSGRMDAENVGEMKTLFGSEAKGRRIAPHRPGLERSNPRGSRGCPVSGQVRNRQHQDQELPSIHSRVDHQGTSGRLKLMSCPSCFWMTAVKEMLWQPQRNGAT